jgi:predicted DsbA family dithiol-disulfide isomerase
MPVKVTYYLEVISSWCHWSEPVWAELKTRYANSVEFNWKIALMDASGLPNSASQADWFYRRSGTMVRSPYMLNSGWFEPGLHEYLAPNLVAEAAKDLGVTDDRVRLAIANAALRDGRKVGRWEEAADVAARAANLDRDELLRLARSAEIDARARATTREFHTLQITQRPAFVIENSLGDKAIFSGIATITPLASTIDTLLSDEAAYHSHAAHYGGPPG